MDLKLKIITMLFVIIAIGYAIFFIINDFNKQKKTEKIDKRITETYEDYDIRKQILNQLDTYDIDKKAKTTIYDSMSASMERFKEMPEDKLNDFIKDIINKTKNALKPQRNSERFEDIEPDKLGKLTKPENADNKLEETDKPKLSKEASSNKEEFEEPNINNIDDINSMIENSVEQIGGLQKNLTQLRSMVDSLAQKCVANGPHNKIKADKPLTPSIEGFENLSSKGYSFI